MIFFSSNNPLVASHVPQVKLVFIEFDLTCVVDKHYMNTEQEVLQPLVL